MSVRSGHKGYSWWSFGRQVFGEVSFEEMASFQEAVGWVADFLGPHQGVFW